jgi:hypothetical protein
VYRVPRLDSAGRALQLAAQSVALPLELLAFLARVVAFVAQQRQT